MVGSSISNSRYTYIHGSKWPNEAVDMHQIIVKKSGAKGFLVYFFALIILANAFYLFLVKVWLISSYFTYFRIRIFIQSCCLNLYSWGPTWYSLPIVWLIKLKPRSLGDCVGSRVSLLCVTYCCYFHCTVSYCFIGKTSSSKNFMTHMPDLLE